jgi:ribosomal protein L29
MAEEPENHTIRLLQEMRAEMREGFSELRGELKAFREEVAAADDENAKILETITHDIADLKTIFVDLQARVIRDERRIKALEKARPDA